VIGVSNSPDIGKPPEEIDAEAPSDDAVSAALGIGVDDGQNVDDDQDSDEPPSRAEMWEVIKFQQQTIDELSERVDELESDVDETHNVAKTASGNAACAESDAEDALEASKSAVSVTNDLSDRVTALEEGEDAADQTAPSLPADVEPASSPLDFFSNVREHNARDTLWENEWRAVRIAKRWDEFATIGNSRGNIGWTRDDVRQALTAELGERPHAETISRVWRKLVDLGSDDVVEKRRNNSSTIGGGEKLIEMDREVADGLQAGRYEHLDLFDGTGSSSRGGGVTPVVTD